LIIADRQQQVDSSKTTTISAIYGCIIILTILCSGQSLAARCGKIHPMTTPLQYRQLLHLSDFSTINRSQDIVDRLSQISEIFASVGDQRGIFPAVYAPTIELGVQYIRQKSDGYAPLTRIMWNFADRYFYFLHRHLKNQSIPIYWQQYYQAAVNCQTHPYITLSYGFLAHLGFDLKDALMKSDVSDDLLADFLLLGNELVNAKPAIINNIKRYYRVDISPLLNGFWMGKTFNQGVKNRDMTTLLTFNALRMEAWMSSRADVYSEGMFEPMIKTGQLMLWRMRLELIRRIVQYR
jgi:hypothetical protein